MQKAEAAVGVAPKKALTGGDQGFVSLKLEAVENVNHNTKKLRFKLPEDDMVSGLDVASAVLTKYKGPDDEKATLRPYTPISDEGMLPPSFPPSFAIVSCAVFLGDGLTSFAREQGKAEDQ